MKKLNITKERFEKSRYFQKKYGKLEYVSESGNLYKTDKGKVLKFVNESPYYDDDDEFCPTNGRVRKTCSYCGNTVIADEEGEYVCPYCGYDSELQDKWNESAKKFSKESSISDYDTQDYGDENYGDPDEFDVKARELGEEWDELGTKTKNEYCESLWYVIGNWIATNRIDEKTAEAILWEAVMSSQDRTDVYDVIMKMVENGKNSTLARRKNK